MLLVMCFFFNDTATTEIYTLSLHDALPILAELEEWEPGRVEDARVEGLRMDAEDLRIEAEVRTGQASAVLERSEEHKSELQSRQYLVCRLLLEKKKNCNQAYKPYHHEVNAK